MANPSARVFNETPPAAGRWTSLNIWLHWLIVGLLIVQFLIGDNMAAFFDATSKGEPAGGLTARLGYFHMLIGATIFVAIAIRLWDRFAHGRPPHPAGEPNWAVNLARVTWFGLYALLLSMPLAGALAWWTGSGTVAILHGWAATALLVLVALHVAGALANQFWFKTDALKRIMPGQGRAA